ncbi:hypothetical protein BC939DRAFT_449197 [Gamsiella multidivaricata]|uniref:uncharacterized protein n=1 Tax=Gamsiella multidivaricata TaxID=101098 RepID=UPI00221EAEB5|nr:uncharacterized protein BC939DRAFT_449197 [Gamsiella multidivaricata]KAI7824770.1 hypothetical protein BC939DRAFT_449197 [Gamsiella multidivaricata]
MIAASAATSKKTKGSHSTTTTAVAVTATTPKAKVFTPGLQNLGNTCFFNSVAQVLTETRSLRTVLSDTGNESAVFPKSLAASTDAGLGPLTTNLKEFLSTMWKQQGGTVAPREIFTQITKKWKVFRGFKQQDSQELMRYLFDGIKQEELDMIKRQLANEAEEEKKFNSQGSTEDDTEDSTEEADSEKKEAENVPKYVPFIDSCFSGKLVSVIVCDACKKCSYAPEDFFDLSLPVRGLTQSGLSARSSLKARFVASKQASVATEAGPSSISEFSLDEKDPIPELEKPSEAHMRHVEKMLRNIGSSDSETLSIQRSLNQFTSVDCLDDDNKFACENCFELIRGSKQNGEASAEQPEDQEGEKEGSDEDKRDQEGDKEGSDEDKGDQESIPEADKIEESTRKQDKNHASNSGMESQSDDGEEGNEQADRFGNSIPTKTSTAAAKKPAKKEEEEKYIFRKAYKRYLISQLPPTLVLHLKRFEQSGRFGLMRKIEDHVDIPVELDMSPYFLPKSEIEDEDEDHEHSQDDGLSKKYRLYGAVVHMGTLAGGHYTNYVLSSKVALPEASKPAVEEKEKINKKSIMDVNGYELPDVSLAVISAQQKEGKKTKGSSASLASVDIAGSDKDVVDAAAGEQREEEEVIDNRQWIACSDTSVRLSSLQDVLASRAYLLFYERC